MSDIPTKTIMKSLKSKGFVKRTVGKSTDHHWFSFSHNGKAYPQIAAKISHGSGYKTYGNSLLKKMKKLLALNSLRQVHDLLACPMDGKQYRKILASQSILDVEASENDKG